MQKRLWIALKKVIRVEEPDPEADVGAPYKRLCSTLEFYNKGEDIDCDVPQAPGADSSMRRRRR